MKPDEAFGNREFPKGSSVQQQKMAAFTAVTRSVNMLTLHASDSASLKPQRPWFMRPLRVSYVLSVVVANALQPAAFAALAPSSAVWY